MSNQSKAAVTGAPGRRRRPGRIAAALTALLMACAVASSAAQAERFVLKTGEVVDGAIIEATRNTVIIQRSIGGMRQMPIEDIQEVRFELAPGGQIAGEFLGWADGVYEVSSGDEIIRLSDSGVVSREPRQQTARLLPTRPRGGEQSTAAAAPSTGPGDATPEPSAAREAERQDQSRPAPDAGSRAAAAETERSAAASPQRQASGTETTAGAAAERQAGDTEAPAAAAPERQASNIEAEAAPQREASGTEAQAAAGPQRQASGAEAQARAVPQRRASGAEAQARAIPGRQTGAEASAAASEDQGAAESANRAAAEPQSQAAADSERDAAEPQSQAAADAKTRAAAGAQGRAAAGEQHAALGDQGALAVKASVDPPEPGDRSMVFKIQLSQPADQTVVLIYGTVDGTAKAGKDYEAQQGMVTLTPGSKSAEVHVPLIEGAPEDGEKRFELVLMADPKIAEVVDRRVIATIKGVD